MTGFGTRAAEAGSNAYRRGEDPGSQQHRGVGAEDQRLRQPDGGVRPRGEGPGAVNKAAVIFSLTIELKGKRFLQMEVECALLEGEQESETAQLQREKELLDQLKEKIQGDDKTNRKEKSQVNMFRMLKERSECVLTPQHQTQVQSNNRGT